MVEVLLIAVILSLSIGVFCQMLTKGGRHSTMQSVRSWL
jgi:hypothetical protein